MKKLIISTDVGYNGIKCVIGEYLGKGEVNEITNFDISSNIIESTNMTTTSSKEDDSSIYIREETDNSRRNFIVGLAAKQYLTSPNNRDKTEDDPFYNPRNDEFERFTTTSFKKLHLAVIYKALKILCENGYDVINEPNKFQLKIGVQLPHVVQEKDSITDKIKGYIKSRNTALSFKLCSDAEYSSLPEILLNAEIDFCSQVLAATICELIDEPEYVDKKPVFVIDCGGKTVGLAVLEKTDEISLALSNTEYAIANVNAAACEAIKEATNNELEILPYQIEEAANDEANTISNNADYAGTRYYSESKKKSCNIKISDIYKEKTTEVATALANFCFDEFRKDIGRAELILIAGGAGLNFYDTLKKEFNKKTDAPVILAKGKVGARTNGSIYSIAVGGLKLATLDYLEEE